jgi:hypothetical protein
MNEEIPNKKFTLKDAFLKCREWYRYFLTKWAVILICGLVGGALGLAYAFTQKPVYKATLTFAIEGQNEDGGIGAALSLASQFGFDLGGGASNMFASGNLMELYKSRNIIEQTLLLPAKGKAKNISYAEVFIQSMEWREKWEEKPELKNLQFLPNAGRENFTRAQDSIMGRIYENIIKTSLNVFQKDKKIDIVTIEMNSPDEYFAKYFTEALANQVADFYTMVKNKKAKANLDILEGKRDSVKAELLGAITGVAVATDNTFGLNPAFNVRRAPASKREVDVQYNAAMLAELIKQSELAKIALQRETPLIQIIDRPIMPLKKEKLGKLMGLVIGGLLAGFLMLAALIVQRLYRQWGL